MINKKEYYIKNKEKILQYQKDYYYNNTEKVKEIRRKYYEKNKEKKKKYQREHSKQTNYANLQDSKTSLQEQVAYFEKSQESLEKQREILLAKSEKLGIRTETEKAFDHMKENIEFLKSIAPETPIREERQKIPIQKPGVR